MKKRKLLLSTLAAAVFATSAGALVACGDGVELPDGGNLPVNPPVVSTGHTVTFIPGADAKLTKIQGNTLTTDKDGKLTAAVMPEAEKADYTFTGWALTAGATVPVFDATNYNAHVFSENTSVYAVFKEDGTVVTPPSPGPVVTEEYDITFLAGEHGTIVGTSTVKTQNGKATFPTVITDEGYEHAGWKDADGNTVTASTAFTKSTTVTAQYTEKSVDPQPPQPSELEETGYDLYVNGTLVANLQQGTGGAPVAPDNLVWDYYAEQITLQAGDEVSFTVANTNIVSMWAEKNTAIQGTTATQGKEIQGTTVIVSVTGTYDVSFTQWQDMEADNRCVAYIGPLAGGELPDPGPIVSEEYGLYVNGTRVAALLQGTGGAPVAPDNLVWDYYAEQITLEAGDKVSFKIEGVTIVSMWAEKNTAIQGTTATQGVEVQGTTVTVSVSGTYDISFTQWQDMVASNRCVAYIGPLAGGEDPDPVDPQPDEYKFYLYGTVGGVDKWDTETGYAFEEIEPDTTETLAHKFKVVVTLGVGDKVKIFKADDQENEWNYNNYEDGCLGENIDWNDSGDLVAAKAGTFTFYLKIGEDGGSSVWVAFDSGEEQPDPPVVTKENGAYNGDTKLTATVAVNKDNPNELMITGLVLTEDTDVSIVYGNTVRTIGGQDKGSGGVDLAISADGKSIKLAAGTYDLYYTFGGTSATKLWVIKLVEAPTTDKNAELEYKDLTATGAFVVGKFHSKGMNNYGWGSGFVMTDKGNGVYELKNIYLYEEDSFKVRLGTSDGKGHSIWKQSDQLNWNGGNANVNAGGEGYYTITIDTSKGNNDYEMVVTYHGTTPAA